MALAVVEKERNQCGFCGTGNHDRCAIGTVHRGPHEKYKEGVVWVCTCTEGGCEPGRRKCSHCNNTVTDEVDPQTWLCIDQDACQALVEQRRDANPLLAQLREAKDKAEMAKIENTKTKAATKEKVAKVGKCLVTGEPTKGGLFKPGMDARYASDRVADVMEGRATKAQALAKMKDDGTSTALQAKFEKNLGIAQEKAKKKAAADKEKAAAKKATAVSGKKG